MSFTWPLLLDQAPVQDGEQVFVELHMRNYLHLTKTSSLALRTNKQAAYTKYENVILESESSCSIDKEDCRLAMLAS